MLCPSGVAPAFRCAYGQDGVPSAHEMGGDGELKNRLINVPALVSFKCLRPNGTKAVAPLGGICVRVRLTLVLCRARAGTTLCSTVTVSHCHRARLRAGHWDTPAL